MFEKLLHARLCSTSLKAGIGRLLQLDIERICSRIERRIHRRCIHRMRSSITRAYTGFGVSLIRSRIHVGPPNAAENRKS